MHSFRFTFLSVLLAMAVSVMTAHAWATPSRQLSATELKQLLHGVYQAIWKGKKARVQVRRDGTLLARSGTRVDVGRWKVRGNELCVAFRVWTKGHYKCGTLQRQGPWLLGLRRKDGTPRLKLRR